jgi:acetolactate synthase-1/2/3 large subunit
MTTGAQHILTGLADAGIELIFTNPGTTEIYFVDALGKAPVPRPVLTLTEAVAAGAADGAARISGQPTALLLHLGPGLANAIAYLHNAKRAHSPIVVVVGDHSQAVADQDPPLASDIDSLAGTFSKAVIHVTKNEHPRHSAARAGYLAVDATPGIVTLIVPSDLSWSDTSDVSQLQRPPTPPLKTPEATLERASAALTEPDGTAVIVGGDLLRVEGHETLERLTRRQNLTVWANTFPARMDRGLGTPHVRRLPYLPEMAISALENTRRVVIAGGANPVPFFGYPHLPDRLVANDCEIITLTSDPSAAISSIAALMPNEKEPTLSGSTPRELATKDNDGAALDPANFASLIAELLPADTIVVDESNTLGLNLEEATATAPSHIWLPALTGGAIGHGLGLAIGAAIAAPERHVLALIADGSSLYTPQALWNHASEALNITTVILSNRCYGILNFELHRLGSDAETDGAKRLLSLSPPSIDHTRLATGFGVPATRATTVGTLIDALASAWRSRGPSLIEAEFL